MTNHTINIIRNLNIQINNIPFTNRNYSRTYEIWNENKTYNITMTNKKHNEREKQNINIQNNKLNIKYKIKNETAE